MLFLTKRLLFSFVYTSLFTMALFAAAPAPFPGNGGLAPLPGQGLGAPAAMGDDQTMQAEFNKILEELEQMPEEKLQELEQQLQAEVKKELEAMTPERRKEFDNEMAEFWRSQGVDPNQLPSLDDMLGLAPQADAVPGQTPADSAQESFAAPKKESTSLEYGKEEVEEILSQLIVRLESLRHTMAIHPQVVRKLQAWKEAIDDLVYFLKIMDTPEHHTRLLATDYKHLLKHLRTLQQELAVSEPRLAPRVTKQDSENDPYEILRISPTATDAQIKETYEKYKKDNDPASLRAQLTAEGFEEQEIQGRVKSAQLNLRTMKDAYEKISNPKIRAQTDRALTTAREQSQAGQEHMQGAINAIINALTQAVYQKNVLEDIQRFMKKYEPTKLEQRKKMEEAEQKRRKEQEAASKLRPTQTSPTSYEPYYLPGTPSYQAPSTGGYNPSYGNYGGYKPERSYGTGGPAMDTKKPEGSSSSGGKSASSDKDKDKDKDKDAKPGSAKDDKKSDKKKSLADEWVSALNAVNKELDLLHSDIIVRDSQNADDQLAPKIQGIVKSVSDAQAAEEKRAAELERAAAEPAVERRAGAEVGGEEAGDVGAADGAPEVPAIPEPVVPEFNRDHLQSITTFIENSARTEPLQKAFKKLGDVTKKVQDEKTKIANKESLLTSMQQKPAFTLLQSINYLQQPPEMPRRSGPAGEMPPKSKLLLDNITRFASNLAGE